MKTIYLAFACITAAAAATATAQTTATWLSAGPVTYVCGGVSKDGMSQLTSVRDTANAELLFTSGPSGAWMADVEVTVTGPDMAQPVKFRSPGPACLVKLPAGDYTVSAVANGQTRTQKVKGGGPVHRVMFNWPN